MSSAPVKVWLSRFDRSMSLLIVIFAAEAVCVALGLFKPAWILLIFLDFAGLVAAIMVARRSTLFWTSVLVPCQIVALVCLLLRGDAGMPVAAGWTAAHLAGLAALTPSLLMGRLTRKYPAESGDRNDI